MATGQNLIDEARDQLNDTESGNYRWSDAELVRYINGAQRQIVGLIPEANPVETEFTTTDAGVRQTIPAGGIKFLKVTNNVNAAGSTRTGVVRYIERDVLDTQVPDWEHVVATVGLPSDTADNFFQHFMHDPREPKVYYIYPKPAASGKKYYVVYSKIPTDLSVVTDTFDLDSIYINAAVEYVIYRALSKDGRYTVGPSKTKALWDNFLRSLGLKVQADYRVSPENNDPENEQAIRLKAITAKSSSNRTSRG